MAIIAGVTVHNRINHRLGLVEVEAVIRKILISFRTSIQKF